MIASDQTDAAAAQAALDAARDGENRITTAIAYGQAGPYLMLWGLVWMAGFIGSYATPGAGGSIWTAATLGGWLGTGVLVAVQTRSRRASALRWRARYAASALALSAYAYLWAALLTSGHPSAPGIYAGTVTGFGYLLAGLWRGPLLAGLGLTVTVLFLAGLPLTPGLFPLYAGFVGGGGLIAGGLLLARRDPL